MRARSECSAGAGEDDEASGRSEGFVGFRSSHRSLLTRLQANDTPAARSGPDLIVVPTSRSAAHPRSGVTFAAGLAVERQCPLLILCSRDASAVAERAALLRQLQPQIEAGLDLTVAHLPKFAMWFDVDSLEISIYNRNGGGRNRRSGPRSSNYPGAPDHPDGERFMANDVGRKRSMALLLCHGLRWKTVLFLDDDVRSVPRGERYEHPTTGEVESRTLGSAELDTALTAIQRGYRAVGWRVCNYDDNSVVCRVKAALGDHQDQFIGGGALLVACDENTPFFPGIYNEDWLFLLGCLESAGPANALAECGIVFQDPYDGFSPKRARSEELGDVLAEGLATLLDGAAPARVSGGDFDYWISALRDRRRMVDELAVKVQKKMSVPGTAGSQPFAAMLSALKEVEYIHRRLQPERDVWARRMQNYVPVWRDDLEWWGKRMSQAVDTDPREFLGTDMWFSRPSGDLAAVVGGRRVLL